MTINKNKIAYPVLITTVIIFLLTGSVYCQVTKKEAQEINKRVSEAVNKKADKMEIKAIPTPTDEMKKSVDKVNEDVKAKLEAMKGKEGEYEQILRGSVDRQIEKDQGGSTEVEVVNGQPSISAGATLKIFVSGSIPASSLEQYAREIDTMESGEGFMIFKASPSRSLFRRLKYKDCPTTIDAKQCQKRKVRILISPGQFRRYKIEAVPFFVINENGEEQMVSGEVTIQTATNHLKRASK